MISAARNIAIVCLLHALSASVSADDAARRQQEFEQTVRPFLARYCFDCHSGDSPDGELQLDILRDSRAMATKDRKTWKKVHTRMFAHVMPPADADQPPKDQRDAMVRWLAGAIDAYDCSGPADPGRETIRRLTRYEYKNTIGDLLGVEARLADDFPLDDVGYGFDNIGDVLTLSPLLLEKYLAAAEEISQRAIVADPLAATASRRIAAHDMSATTNTSKPSDDARMLYSQGELRARYEFPADGEYLIRTHAYGDQAGDEPARLQLKLDGRDLQRFDVKATADKPADYDWRGRIERGNRQIGMAFVNDYYRPEASDPSRRDRNLAIFHTEIVGPLGEQTYPESHRRIFIAAPGKDISDEEAARQILRKLASRAFRRPATEAEVQRLTKLAQLGQSRGGRFEAGIQLALQAILVSPHFLFKVELDPAEGDKDGIRQLNEYELATRLSYFLWNSMPDDELFQLARRGQLRQQLAPQVQRMLRDSKADALVENFAMQWLQLRRLDDMQPDRRRFREFNGRLRADMRTETKLFFAAIMREDRSVLELVDADFTFLNERLARLYGIEGIRGEQFQRVDTGAAQRGGVLTHASVLTATSNPTRTSPVKRGKWIMETILGTPPPDPPADVPDLEETQKVNPSLSLRKQLEMHRENPSCATCHAQMDALGLAFENFNAIGAWRTRDGNSEIDPSGTLPGGEKFSGPGELKRLLLANQREDFLNCLTEKMLTYALGRGVEYYDRCAIEKIVKAIEKDNFKFSRLVIEIAKSEPFQKRRK